KTDSGTAMAATLTQDIANRIALDIGAKPQQAVAAIALLDEGATVPFIARYRKEVTGGLDDTQLRLLADRPSYLRELEARRPRTLSAISEPATPPPELEASIANAPTTAELEDLDLPYTPQRRAEAEIAREKGLGPRADAIFEDGRAEPAALAEAYITEAVPD